MKASARTLAEIVDGVPDATRDDWIAAVEQIHGPPQDQPFDWPVIGLAGKARAGKDTVGQILVRDHGFTRVSFADGVREAALALDPLVELYETDTVHRLSQVVAFYGWDEAKAFPEVRRTLQRIGSEAGWMIHGQSLWIDLAERKLAGPTVITDVRFAHETAWLHARGGLLWRIERPLNDLSLSGEVSTHASEAGDLGREPDTVIVNDGTLETLADTVDSALKTS